jgi:hypothetical protein
MAALRMLREAWELVPVLVLLLVGAVIAIKSGLDSHDELAPSRLIAGNVSKMLFRVAGYVVALLALQHAIGQHPALGW